MMDTQHIPNAAWIKANLKWLAGSGDGTAHLYRAHEGSFYVINKADGTVEQTSRQEAMAWCVSQLIPREFAKDFARLFGDFNDDVWTVGGYIVFFGEVDKMIDKAVELTGLSSEELLRMSVKDERQFAAAS